MTPSPTSTTLRTVTLRIVRYVCLVSGGTRTLNTTKK
jgi:hypothetical protein